MAPRSKQSFNIFDPRVLLPAFLAISLVLVTVYFREGESGPLHTVQGAISTMIAPFDLVGATVGSGVDSVGEAVDDMMASPETLSAFEVQNQELREKMARAEEIAQENERLTALLELKELYDLDTVAARVIARSSNSWDQVITINKGSNDGVITGQSVMGPSGLVGQVISTTSASSNVRLLTDPQSGVAVLIQSNRAEGIVYGSLEGLLYLENLDADTVVQEGDNIVTSGLGGSYARGLLVGMVVKVDETKGSIGRKIVVSPNSKTGPLEEVLVVKSMNSEGDAFQNKEVGPTEGDPEEGGEQ